MDNIDLVMDANRLKSGTLKRMDLIHSFKLMVPFHKIHLHINHVDMKSPKEVRNGVEKIARYANREGTTWDGMMYCQYEDRSRKEWDPFVIIADGLTGYAGMTETIMGAGGFGKVRFEGSSEKWTMHWIWIHPYFRGRGILKELWPIFLKNYDDFYIWYPERGGQVRSKAMEAFVAKYGSEKQRKQIVGEK